MSVRDLLLTFTVLSVLPICLFRPWVGVLAWSWLAYMNPHRLTWGFAQSMPFAQLVAVATLVGFIFTASRKPFLVSREILLLGLLWGWFGLTSVTAFYPEDAWTKFLDMSKVLLMALLVIPLFQDRQKLRILLFVIAASLGFYGAKGGIFVMSTGGQSMVLGAPGSFIAANTELALALNMSLPILYYLAKEETRRWLRLTLFGAFGLTLIAVPFTYSRGGLVGLAAVLVVLYVKARRRIVLVPVVAAGILAFLVLAPEQLLNRMRTLENVQADGSANLRLMSWQVALGIAQDSPIMGGGFRVFHHRATYDIYMPEYPRAFGHDAHSIYFNLLGEHGWVGLALFLGLLTTVLLRLHQIRGLAKSRPEVAWAGNYAHMLQASLAAYLVNGATLSAAYFDLAYQLLILTPLIHAVAMQQLAAQPAESAAAVPVPATPAPAKVG